MVSAVQSRPSPPLFLVDLVQDPRASYRRYAIMSEAELREGVAKLAKLHESQPGSSSPTVVPPLRAEENLGRDASSPFPQRSNGRLTWTNRVVVRSRTWRGLLTAWLPGAQLLEIA